MLKNKGCKIYITSDINIDCYNTDNQTCEYLERNLQLIFTKISNH